MSFAYTTLRVEELDDGRIIRVNLSRPKSLNAMNLPFFTELGDLFTKINQH
jgi:enoyl-CoA hydratase/carnithine racemase